MFSKYAPLINPPTSCQQNNPRFTIFTHQIIYWLCSSLGTTLLESSSLTLSPEQVLSRPAGSSPKHILMMLCPCACAGCLVSQVPLTLYSLLWEISPSGTFLSRIIVHFLRLFLFQNVPPSHLADTISGCRILGWQLFFLCIQGAICCFMSSKAAIENILIHDPGSMWPVFLFWKL